MALDSAKQDTVELPRLLSTQGLSEYLGVPISTLYLWRATGQGPISMKVGKHVRYRFADVETWLEMRVQSEREPAP